jgi:hypothetical protein
VGFIEDEAVAIPAALAFSHHRHQVALVESVVARQGKAVLAESAAQQVSAERLAQS